MGQRRARAPLLGHLVETVYPGSGFLGYAADSRCHLMPVSRRRLETIGEPFPNNSELLVFALLLKAEDKKKGYGLELPNIKK